MLRPLRDFVAFDFETTGLERDADEIVEIGSVRVRDGVLAERFSRLLKAQKPLSPLVESLTGLTPALLAEAVDPGPALRDFLDFAGDLPLVAHNSDFDAAFLQEALKRLGLPPAGNRVYDSLLLARTAWPTFDSHRLEDLARTLGMPPDRAHRALPDAERSAMLWNLAQEKLASYAPSTLDGLARVLAAGPAAWRDLFDPPSAAPSPADAAGTTGPAAPAAVSAAPAAVSAAPAAVSAAPAAGTAAPTAGTWTPDANRDGKGGASKEGRTGKGDRGGDGLFGAGGPVERAFAALGRPFEGRAGQGRLAALADRALAENCFLAVESDPGTGRTLACLAAAARAALVGNRTVGFAVAGRQRLDRIAATEFPLLRALFGPALRLAVLKAPSAYLSPRKYADVMADPAVRLSDAERLSLLPLVTWKQDAGDGDVGANMGFNHERQKVLWTKLSAEAYAGEPGGFAQAARERAARAHLVLVTHDLVLDDVAVDFALLPPCEAWVFDDAHRLPEAGWERFGREIGFFRLRHILQLLMHSKAEDRGLLAALDRAAAHPSLPEAFRGDVARLREKAPEPEKQLQKFFNKIGKHAQKRRKDGENRIRYADKLVTEFNAAPEGVIASLSEAESLLAALDAALESAAATAASPGIAADGAAPAADAIPAAGLRSLALDLRRVAGLLRGFRADLEHLASPGREAGEVFWIEEFANPHRAMIRCAPRDPGAILSEKFHPQAAAAVYVSASLALGDQLGFFCRQAGLEPAHAAKVRTAAVRGQGASRRLPPLFLAKFSPVLSGSKAMDAMSGFLGRALRGLGLPAFLHFTHVGLLKQARAILGEELAKDGRLVAAQHVDGSRDGLLHLFRHRKDACLLGTDAFVEGLGPGDTLPAVAAFTKLPFPVPSDPLVAAALERVNEAGENPLYDFLLPTAILKLKQELGRLPHAEGGGPASAAGGPAIWILDPRLCTEKYARAFVRGLGREVVICASEQELLARTSALLSGAEPPTPTAEAAVPAAEAAIPAAEAADSATESLPSDPEDVAAEAARNPGPEPEAAP